MHNQDSKQLFNNSSYQNLNKILRATFIMSLKNERAWVFTIFSSVLISLVCFIGYSLFSNSFELLPPQMLAIFLIPAFVSGIYFSIYLIEWKDTSLVKRIKFLGIKRWMIIFSFMLMSFVFSLIAELITIIMCYFASIMLVRIHFSYIGNLFYWNWIWFIFATFLISSVIMMICNFFVDRFNNKNIKISLPIIILIILLITSDVLIPSFFSTRSSALTYIGYLSVTKYAVWLLLITSSFTFVDFDGGIQQIVFDETMKNTTLFTTNIIVLIISSLAIFTVVFVLNIVYFKWK